MLCIFTPMKTIILLYIDPGSGFMFAQILTAIVGLVIIFRNKIIALKSKIFNKKDEDAKNQGKL